MLVRPYEMPWRPAYEAWAAAAWLLGLLYFVYITGSRALFTASIALTLSAFAMLMMSCRARQATRVLTVRASLSGRAMQVITTRRPGQLTPRSGAGVPGLRLRMAAGAFAAALRTRQDRLPGVHAAALAALRCWATTSIRSPTPRSACPTSTASNPGNSRCTGRCRTSRAARCWSAPPSPARAWHWPI